SRGGGRQPALFKVCETPLSEYSDGLISAEDAVGDVCVGFDPAGRPEFIAAASATSVVVVDTQCFDESLRANATEAVVQAFAKQQPQHHQSRRPPSETFCASFAAAEVVRVLVPERYHAAFAVDVALVIVFDNGEVRYVERNVVGGAVQLLLEHHRQRQARQSEVGVSMLRDGDSDDPRALPHVLYAYNLSSVVHNVCVTAAGSHAAAHFVVNDAALCYDAAGQQMRLVVAGAETQSADRSEVPCSTTGWWAVAHGVVCVRDTLAQHQQQHSVLAVSSFSGPQS
ncbi:hypothetical protein DQ04_23441000, partial [Trypanosoma grayi]|uniref:hypothetical protein n=1 Tax=Trypanosoma grayi TaxID=71804 RepID=UPI0004F4BE50